MEKTYKTAFKELGRGFADLGFCLWRSFVTNATDIGRCAMRHILFTIALIAIYVSMFLTMGKARAERDKCAKEAYQTQMRNDTLEILLNK